MAQFGRCGGGGRRIDARESAPLPAMVTTLSNSHPAVLVNISRTGAQLRGSNLPHAGEELLIKMGSLQAFATVAWSRGDHCGVEFECRIAVHELQQLRREASTTSLMRLSPEEKLALDDWTIGLAR